MIIVEPTSGLCSRMFVISEAYELAKNYNKRLIILWTKTTDCNIGYFDIFEKTQFNDINVKVVEFTKFANRIKDLDKKRIKSLFILAREACIRLIYIIRHTFYTKFYKMKCSIFKNAYLDENSIMDEHLVENNNCYIEAYNMITGKSNLEAIMIKKSFLDAAENIVKPYLPYCIGLHIRRTDHKPAITNSETAKFITEIEKLLKKDNRLYFYLATDDWKEEERIKGLFGTRIITQPNKVLNRFTEKGMYSSIIDFLCLSKTNYIIGSYGSIFSKFSSEYGNIKLEIL